MNAVNILSLVTLFCLAHHGANKFAAWQHSNCNILTRAYRYQLAPSCWSRRNYRAGHRARFENVTVI